MKSYYKFYRETVYPFQNGVLKLVKNLNTPFYLTDGTALSRHYFNHRYSDDLDMFVNQESSYSELVTDIFKMLEKTSGSQSFRIDYNRVQRSKDYTQLFLLHHAGFNLKLDFINDIAQHFGGFEENALLGKIDSWRNILSNKITALLRLESKDFVDVWIIARQREFSWKELFTEAKQKDAGIDPIVIFELIKSFPEEALDLIKWVKPININLFKKELNVIADDIFKGGKNSLFYQK